MIDLTLSTLIASSLSVRAQQFSTKEFDVAAQLAIPHNKSPDPRFEVRHTVFCSPLCAVQLNLCSWLAGAGATGAQDRGRFPDRLGTVAIAFGQAPNPFD